MLMETSSADTQPPSELKRHKRCTGQRSAEPSRWAGPSALTVSAALGAAGHARGHGGHQRVLDGHLPHASHILADPADLRHTSVRAPPTRRQSPAHSGVRAPPTLAPVTLAHQDAAARHCRLGSLQRLPHKVHQRRRGDLEAVRVGAVREQREGPSRLQGQDLGQRNLLQQPGRNVSRGHQQEAAAEQLTL